MLCRALAICMPLGRDGVTLHCSMPKLPTECGLQCKLISLSLLCSSLKMIFILEIGKSVYVLYQSRYSQIRTKKCLIDADNYLSKPVLIYYCLFERIHRHFLPNQKRKLPIVSYICDLHQNVCSVHL